MLGTVGTKAFIFGATDLHDWRVQKACYAMTGENPADMMYMYMYIYMYVSMHYCTQISYTQTTQHRDVSPPYVSMLLILHSNYLDMYNKICTTSLPGPHHMVG